MAQTESKQALTNVEQPPMEQKPTEPIVTASQKFTNRVISEFGATTASPIQLSDKQKRLVQGYFVIIDKVLKDSETKRLAKNANNSDHRYDNDIPYDWQHINMAELALDAVHAARMGLDMQEEAHLYPIPYANKAKGIYSIAFIDGYAGKQYKALKYAITPPKAVTIEVVYSNDKFKVYKKSRENPYDSYDFDIPSPFDRGEIAGGFGYIEYADPAKNELVILSLNDIKKRAQKGSPEFWGTKMTGKQISTWENNKKVTKDADGWSDEMARKTIVREVYGKKHIPIDPSKIDDDFQHFKEREVIYAQAEIENEAEENNSSIPIDFEQDRPLELPQAPVEQKISTAHDTTMQEQPITAAPTAPSTTEYEAPDF